MVTIDQIFDPGRAERITAEARQVHFWRTVLTVLAGLLYGAGWITARLFGVLWLALTWSAVAVKVGWTEGRKPRPQ